MLMVSFSSCFNEQLGRSNVVLAVPGVPLKHGNNVGLCKFCHFDNVCTRTVRCLHIQHFLLVGIAEFGALGLLDVDEHHEHVSEEHVFFAFDSNLLSEVFSQAVHKALARIIIVLLAMIGKVWEIETRLQVDVQQSNHDVNDDVN